MTPKYDQHKSTSNKLTITDFMRVLYQFLIVLLMFQELDSQVDAHKQHLKACKKIYDQLHLAQRRGMMYRKSRISSPEYHSQDLNNAHHRFLSESPKKNSMPKIASKQKLSIRNKIKGMISVRNQSKKGSKIKQIASKPLLKSYSKEVELGEAMKKAVLDLQFTSYLDFIHSSNQHYHLLLNFDKIRNLSSSQAWDQLDIKNSHIISAFYGKIIENIKSIDKLLLTVKQDNSEALLELQNAIQHYCRLYFNNYEKIKTEIILREHCFKLFSFRIRPIFTLQRICIYFVFLIVEQGMIIHEGYRLRLRKTLEKMREINQLMNEVIEKNRKSDQVISEAFKILKSVSEVEKKISQIQHQTTSIKSETESPILAEIYRKLSPFVEQNKHHLSYQTLVKTQMLLSWKFMHVPPTPFLPQMSPLHQYTAVIDLHQTIIYFDPKTHVLKYRPGMDTLFTELKSHNFEIILFTTDYRYHQVQNSSETIKYVDLIVSQIQSRGKIFDFQLYGEHLSLYNGRFTKDIRRLGRDMKKILIIDDIRTNFDASPGNGIQVSSWMGDKSDSQLYQIMKVINQIPISQKKSKRKNFITRNEKRSHSQLQKIEKSEKMNQGVDLREILKANTARLKRMLEREELKRVKANEKNRENQNELILPPITSKTENSHNEFIS